MPPAVVATLARFRAAIAARFGARLREMVLFGSYARGDAHEESDIDVLVVIDDLTDTERTEVIDMSYFAEDRDSDGWLFLCPLPFSTTRATDLRARDLGVFRAIEREGVRV